MCLSRLRRVWNATIPCLPPSIMQVPYLFHHLRDTLVFLSVFHFRLLLCSERSVAGLSLRNGLTHLRRLLFAEGKIVRP